MNIVGRGGHNHQAQGADGYLNEVNCDREVWASVQKYLRQAGHNVTDLTPPDGPTPAELYAPVAEANNQGADLFVSIHLNAFQDTTNPMGTEVLCYPGGQGEQIAGRVVNKLAALGFKNRGVKDGSGLYEIGHTKMTAILVEVCFVDSQADSNLYNQLGADTIGRAIAEGILDTAISAPQQPSQPVAQSAPQQSNGYFYVTVTSENGLNVRTGPGSNCGINMAIPQGGKYTIVETSGCWGKLKSGAGWIHLGYTKRV